MTATTIDTPKTRPAIFAAPTALIECIQDGKASVDLRISARSAGGVTILDVLGRLDPITLPEAEDLMLQLIDDGDTKIIVNCELLQYVSSNGFRFLLLSARRLREAGGSMRICAVNGTVREIFEISGFATLFDLFRDEVAALERF